MRCDESLAEPESRVRARIGLEISSVMPESGFLEVAFRKEAHFTDRVPMENLRYSFSGIPDLRMKATERPASCSGRECGLGRRFIARRTTLRLL